MCIRDRNAHRAAEQTKAIPEYPAAVKKPLQGEKTTKTTPADNTLKLSLIHILKTLVVALGAGLGEWGAVNLMAGYGGDNPSANAHIRERSNNTN